MPFDTKRNVVIVFTSTLYRSCIKVGLAVLCLLALSQVKAQAPVPDFRANVVTGCAPLSVQFTDLSTGNPVFWNWDLGNGQLSTLQNPTGFYSTPGSYTITLVVRNANGINSVTKTNYIVLSASPTAAFSVNSNIACVPATLQFTDQSVAAGGPIVSWEWDFGDGTRSTLQNPQKTYTASGFYTVSLRITSSTGCTSFVSLGNYIRIVSGITPDFSFTQPGSCSPPFLVNFRDLTSGPGSLTYQWDFGNSTNSTVQNPTASFAAPGTYTVQLIVNSQFGCSGTTQKSITIGSTNIVINSPDTVCLNEVVNFQNNSTPTPISAIWDFGNGKQSRKISDTTSFATPGNFPIKLVNTYQNCVDSTIKTIYVRPRPTVDFTAPVTAACKAPFTVNFQDISPNAVSWNWSFGDGGTSTQKNPTHLYNSSGQFDVTLTITDNRGCQNTVTKTSFVRIIKPTVAVANAPAGGCAPFLFTPVSAVNALDGVASWFWDYGDGFTSTAVNPPAHSYGLGIYTFKLVIVTNGGCTDSVVYTNGIQVGSPSNNGFVGSPLDVCAGDSVSFTPDPSNIANEWFWDFGDGSTSNLPNPKHSYSDTGFFNVTLVSTNNGCQAAFTRNAYVHVRAGVADFSFAVDCSDLRTVRFSDSSLVDPGYGPTTYFWQFGDPLNSTSTAQNPSFTYPAGPGIYLARLTITNGSCSNTFAANVNLTSDKAGFAVSKANACKNEPITLTPNASNPGTVSLYQWSIDNGPFGPLGTPAITSFNTPGPHSIALAIRDLNGCTDTVVRTTAVTISGPTANFTTTVLGACKNAPITFSDLSTTTATNLVNWKFDFGDGQIQTFTNPPFTHSYADTGRYQVKLTVQDNIGCTDSVFLPINLSITSPKANFSSPIKICPTSPLQFTDSSTGYGLSYNWTFGDGNGSTVKDPIHIYGGNDNNYTVKLVVTDTVGCRDSLVRANYISVIAPKPLFDIKDTSTICPPLETKFTFRGQDYESFYWDFGDGSSSTLQNPTYFYNSYGTFTPKLFLIGFGGCIDSASARVVVHNPIAESSINYTPLNACNSLTVDFSITTPPGTKFTFFSGDGSVDSSQNKSFQYFYKSFGFFYPQIVMVDSAKCPVGLGGSLPIRIIGAEPLFGINDKAFCDSLTVLFANYTIGNDPIVSSLWDFGDGNNSTVSDPSHFYNVPGTYIPSLTVTTQAGCTKTLTDTIRVYPTPLATITGDTIVCIGEQVLLNANLAQPDSTVKWSWTMGNGSNLTGPVATTVYQQPGRFPVLLSAINVLGCTGDTTVNVFVPPNPAINILANPVTIPVSTSVPIPVTYGPNIAGYAWTPISGLSCIDCAVPIANPKSTTTYKVTATDIYGCKSTNEITIVVVCNEKNYFVPNTFSPNNDGNNDIFYPRGTGLARVQSMRIFNRWGEMVFERRNFNANDSSMGWDGTAKGKKGETDTYVYVIEFVCENSVIIPFKGNVTLIR